MGKRLEARGSAVRRGIVAALLGLASLLGAPPAFGQQAPNGPAALSVGPGASGDATQMVGHVDTPTAGTAFYPGANVGITGWALDSSAQGWSGIDEVQVYLGQMGGGGTLLGQGNVGLARPDVAQALGASTPAVGFQVTATGYPGLAQASGPVQLNLYFHTPSRGWWSLPANVTLSATPAVQGQSQQNGVVVTGAYLWGKSLVPESLPNAVLSNSRGNYRVLGFAFDSAEIGAPHNGIVSVDVYLDGDSSNPDYVDLGLATLGDQGGQPTPHGYPEGAGFSLTVDTTVWNWTGVQPGITLPWPTGQHTLHFVATTMTGKADEASAPIVVTQDSDVP